MYVENVCAAVLLMVFLALMLRLLFQVSDDVHNWHRRLKKRYQETAGKQEV